MITEEGEGEEGAITEGAGVIKKVITVIMMIAIDPVKRVAIHPRAVVEVNMVVEEVVDTVATEVTGEMDTEEVMEEVTQEVGVMEEEVVVVSYQVWREVH